MESMADAAGQAGVAVLGHSKTDARHYAQAERVGALLAGNGYIVINGGYGGTMEAGAKGAVEAGGEVVGVTCTAWDAAPNRYSTRHVRTGDLHERLAALLELGDAGYVVLPGGTGTLVELASCWEWMNKRLMAARPLVCVGAFWRPVVDVVRSAQPRSAETVHFIADVRGLGEYFPPRRTTAPRRGESQ